MSIIINKNFNLSSFVFPLKQRDISSSIFIRNFSDKKKSDDFALIIAGKNGRSYGFAHDETAETIEQIDNSLERASFNSKNISILTHAPVNLFDNEPKFSTLIKGKPEIYYSELTEMSKKIKKNDRLWIFLIGHGISLDYTNPGLISDYTEKKVQVISPKDVNESCRLVSEGININIIADCCHSGMFVPLTNKNIVVLCSSNATKLSYTNLYSERYATKIAEAYAETPSLLKAHLRTIDPEDIPGYDSYSFVLCNLIARKIFQTPAIDLDGDCLAKYRSLEGTAKDAQNNILTKVNKIIRKVASKWEERPSLGNWHYSYLPDASERFAQIADQKEIKILEPVVERML